jgi:hypothetical protein
MRDIIELLGPGLADALCPVDTETRELLRALAERRIYRERVLREMREAGARGQLTTNDRAPSWPEYADAEKAVDERLTAWESKLPPDMGARSDNG